MAGVAGERSHVRVKNIGWTTLVGTVYLSPKPGEDNFICEGQKVTKGDTICIIEAMKIFNEIESEKTGTVKLIYVENESPVEFGQPIVEIIPD